ncbi:hypothetical protein E2C01_010370 [Portunus trituberculatus]|uniref:Uncharacterized protein n=1 Tax=Portunus trituberculatus TaxID=210409 RepID=A0A5B7D895_PORTR|nr:hypothetical protein [Portunus trituberculatus]
MKRQSLFSHDSQRDGCKRQIGVEGVARWCRRDGWEREERQSVGNEESFRIWRPKPTKVAGDACVWPSSRACLAAGRLAAPQQLAMSRVGAARTRPISVLAFPEFPSDQFTFAFVFSGRVF